MLKRKTILKKKTLDLEDEEEVDRIERGITDEIANREFERLEKITGDLDVDSNTNIWKELRKAFPPKSKPIPSGIKNMQGKTITNPREKEKITLDHFKHRMRKRAVKEEVKEIDKINLNLFENRLKKAKLNKSEPFKMQELEKVLKSLKCGKSRDPDQYISELFKEGVIGYDLKQSILMMMNRMKSELIIPPCLTKANITVLHKKDCKLDLNNYRGIFVCSLLRTILMKLIYERTYEIVS